MAWRAIPGPLSKRKRRLDSLEAAQGAPRDLRRDSRGERTDNPGGIKALGDRIIASVVIDSI